MNARKFSVGLVCAAVIAAALVLYIRNKRMAATQEMTVLPSTSSVVPASETAPTNLVTMKRGITQLPEDPRPAVQKVYDVVRAVDFHNFDPRITDYEERTNRNGRVSVVMGTPTYFASVRGERVDKIASLMESANPSHDINNLGIKTWYRCTGTWTEQAAIAETIAILQRLNDSTTLADITRTNYLAIPVTVSAPDGTRVRVTPFHIVELYDKADAMRVRVEFRMGTNGPDGVTEFFRWP